MIIWYGMYQAWRWSKIIFLRKNKEIVTRIPELWEVEDDVGTSMEGWDDSPALELCITWEFQVEHEEQLLENPWLQT